MSLAPLPLLVRFDKFPVLGEERPRKCIFELKAFLESLWYFLRKKEAIGDGLGDTGIAEVGHGPLMSQ